MKELKTPFLYDNNDFKLYKKIVAYNHYLRRFVTNNIPSVHRDLRIHILDESYNLVKYTYEASINKGNIRSKYINELIVTISMLDYLTSLLLDLCPNIKKYLVTSLDFLVQIKNITYAWRVNNEKDG